jgi:sortase A
LTRFRRRLGAVLIAAGVLAAIYGAVVFFWHDPATDLYARYKQHQLSDQLEESFAQYREDVGIAEGAPAAAPSEPVETQTEPEPVVDQAALEEQTRAAAKRYLSKLKLGDPLGRIVIPDLDIDPVVVNGTRWGPDLSRGPGRYPETSLPGLGALTAIAGHRTTFGAPFRHIDKLKAGDVITLELPYGTFRYRVVGHEIVDDEDWTIIKPRPYEALVLSACHPLFTADQRWVVYARLDEVDLPDGESYSPPSPQQTAQGAEAGSGSS